MNGSVSPGARIVAAAGQAGQPDTAASRAKELATDVLGGLWADPPSLPPRWFYDERGSRLFEEITRLPEYYPTRAELEILHARSAEIADVTEASEVLELGAGSSTKTRVLLDALTAGGRKLLYVPLDVSHEVLHESAGALREQYPALSVQPRVADFHATLGPEHATPGNRLVVFLGGTVGNFTEDERAAFLRRVRGGLAPGDFFLLGADLVKAPSRLVAAYDDAAGVTAAFNLNLIDVIRSMLGATGLHPGDFDHRAVWNADAQRIEMWLRARRDVRARFPTLDRDWRLAAGAGVLTEISRKFTPGALRAELTGVGLEEVAFWTDEAGDYSLSLARAD